MYTVEMFAFSCTVISSGHSSYLSACCRNTDVPVSVSLLPPSHAPVLLLSGFCSHNHWSQSASPSFFPSAQTFLRLQFQLAIFCFLPSPFTVLVLPAPPLPPPTVCRRVENTIIYSFVFPPRAVYFYW